jgi:phosphate/sulfate permease
MELNEKEKEELKRLYIRLNERNKEFQSAKLKRSIITIIGFSIAYFYLFFSIYEKYSVITWDTIIFLAIISPIVSFFHFFVNSSIFGALTKKSMEEYEILRRIIKKIKEFEDAHNIFRPFY